MKKVFEKIIEVLLIPVVVIILGIVLIFTVPFDYIKYKCSPYYKKERKKYKLFAASRDGFGFYNEIFKNDLPIKYVPNPADDSLLSGWFVYNNTLMILNVCSFEYDAESNSWKCCRDEDEDQENEATAIFSLDEYIENEICEFNRLSQDNSCNDAVVIIDMNDLDDPKKAQEERRFLIYRGNRAKTVKEYCKSV